MQTAPIFHHIFSSIVIYLQKHIEMLIFAFYSAFSAKHFKLKLGI